MVDSLTAIVTGVAPFSLGEAIALELHSAVPAARIITVDLHPNPRLESRLGDAGTFIEMDLNPLNYEGTGGAGFSRFSERLGTALRTAVTNGNGSSDGRGIDLLFNNVGVYGFGPLVDTPPEVLASLIGVNYVGQLLATQTVMALNREFGVDNSRRLKLCKVGSFQGIHLRPGRPVYAPSKAIGLDTAQALALGAEAQTVIYLAVGPIDTHMLHYNLWGKAGGDQEFIRDLYIHRDLDLYRAAFVDGDVSAFRRLVEDNPQCDALSATYSQYLRLKDQYSRTEEFATESAHDIGRDLVARMTQPDLTSGILVFDKQWAVDKYVRRVGHRPFALGVDGAYNKFETIVRDMKWHELPANGTPAH